MVNLSITKDGTIVSVKKAVETEIIDFLVECIICETEETPCAKRIDGWMKDFHISDFQIRGRNTLVLIRELDEKESESIDLEMLNQAMRDIMMDFINFIKSLIEESNSADVEENAPEGKPAAKFFHIDQKEDGFAVEGNIHPMEVISYLLAVLKEMIGDEDNQTTYCQSSASSAS